MKLIAETAWHHDGDIGFFEILLDNILLSSADIVKLHILLDIDRYIDKTHPAYSFLDERVFNKDQWKSILNKVASSSKELMLLLNDYESVDLAAEFQPSLVEVHSVALNNLNLLKHIVKYWTKIFRLFWVLVDPHFMKLKMLSLSLKIEK